MRFLDFIYDSAVKHHRNRDKYELVTRDLTHIYTLYNCFPTYYRHGVPLAVEKKKQAEITTSTRRGSTVRRHYVQPLSPPANPFIHRSFPDRKNAGGGLCDGGAYPRSDTALSVPADTGRMSPEEERVGSSQPSGGGPMANLSKWK